MTDNAPGPHQVHFFRKSFEDCTGDAVKRLAHELIENSEEKYGVAYTREAQTLIINSSVESVEDPLLKAVFGFSDRLDLAAILDFYEKNAILDEKEAVSFVNLCVVLGELNRAEKFAEKTGKDFEILKILKEKGEGQIQMWLEKTPEDQISVRLTSLILRRSGNDGGNSLRPLLELWGEGFYWDALCLVRILMPNHSAVDMMKEKIPMFLKQQDGGVLAGILKWAFTDSAKEGPMATAYDEAHLKHLDALTVFRMVKIDIGRNEKSSSGDLEKLGIRGKCSQVLRLVLLKALLKLGAQEAKTMAEDAFEYVKTSFGHSVPDYFPITERVFFKSFFGMIVDVYSAVVHVLQPNSTSSSTLSIEDDKHDGLTSLIFAKWRKDYPEIWDSSTGFWARASFVTTCHSLFSHVAMLEKILETNNEAKMKMLKMTVRLCLLFAGDEFEPEETGIRFYMDVAEDFDFSRDQAHVFAHAFTINMGSESASSHLEAHHMSGDEFIQEIKQHGIHPPPTDISAFVEKKEKEEIPAKPRPYRVNTLFHPADTQLPAELERGTAVAVVSDEVAARFENFDVKGLKMVTVWEAPKEETKAPIEAEKENLPTTTASVASVVSENPLSVTAPISITVSATPEQGNISRSQHSDDGWGESPSPVLPPAAPSQGFCSREQYDEQTRQIQQQERPRRIQPPIRAGMMSSLDRLLYSYPKNGAGDAPTEEHVTSDAHSVSGATDEDEDLIPGSAAEMAANRIPVVHLPTLVVPPSTVSSRPSVGQKKFTMGGFEEYAHKTGFGEFGEGGSLGPRTGPCGYVGNGCGTRGGHAQRGNGNGGRGGRGGGYSKFY